MNQAIQQAAGIIGAEPIQFVPFDVTQLCKLPPRSLAIDAAMYFQTCVPISDLDLNGICILSADSIKEENLELIPSYLCLPLGYVSVARTDCGDAFAVDVQTGQVHLLSHEKFEGDRIEPGWNDDHSGFLPSLPITRENVVTTAEGSWNSVSDFLAECLNHVAESKTAHTP